MDSKRKAEIPLYTSRVKRQCYHTGSSSLILVRRYDDAFQSFSDRCQYFQAKPPLLVRVVEAMQHAFFAYLSDEDITTCCLVSKQCSLLFSHPWRARVGIVATMGKDVKFPSLSVRKYEGFRTMFMCPFLTGYRPPYFLSCFLSREKDRAVQELSFIRRFIKTQRPSSFTVYVHQNLRPEIVSLLQDTEVRRFRLCSAAALGFQPGVRKHPQRHFESGVWNHLTSFSAQSPCMFTALGQRIILAITQGGSIEELRLTDTTISGKAWNSLLSKLTVPKLSVFEVEGHLT